MRVLSHTFIKCASSAWGWGVGGGVGWVVGGKRGNEARADCKLLGVWIR